LQTTTSAITANNHIDTIAGGTRALFDGIPAPIVSAQSGQIVAIVPYGVAGKISTQLQVEFNGQHSAALTVPVTDVAPGIFTDQPLGKGSPLVLNADASHNSPTNPAKKGSNITFFVTGEGVTSAAPLALAPVDGRLATTAQTPVQPVIVGVNGAGANILYAGAAPGTAGIMQVNVQLDSNAPSGALELVVAVGNTFSPPLKVSVQ
jgi:uncharacterized protein (TIGR03437 family)